MIIERLRPIIAALSLLTGFALWGPAAAQPTRLKTSYSALTANMAAYWLAKDAKIFEKHGLSVDVVLIESGVTTGPGPDRRRNPDCYGRRHGGGKQ